jgi:mannose-6-phosphate isomerase-like protein (cupin superfamily)
VDELSTWPQFEQLRQRGSVLENRVTGERAVVLDDGLQSGRGIAHLTVSPNGAVAGEHFHPAITERFQVLEGELVTRIAGAQGRLTAGQRATVAPKVPHDWWNESDTPVSVIVEVEPAEPRFAMMIATLFGLANSGRTNSKGLPGPLLGALIAREYADVIRFTRPPAAVQAVALPVLAAIGRARGLRAVDPEFFVPHAREDPDPAILRAAGLSDPPGDT